MLFVWCIFSFCPFPQFLKIRLVVDGRCIGCSNYRTVSCTDIINITLMLFGFFSLFLDFGHIERFYLFLLLLEERCLRFRDIKPFIGRSDNNIVYLNIGFWAKSNVLTVRCRFSVWQTWNGRNNFTISLNLHIQTLHL